MITVTERAVAGIEELLVAQEPDANQGVRLVREPTGGVGITIAPPADGDEVVVLQGEQPRLIVEGSLAPSLDGAVLDLAEGNEADGRPRFTLTKAGRGAS